MTIRFLAITALILVAGGQPGAAQPQELVDKFEKRTITTDSMTMGYRLFIPEDYDPEQSYPLVLALHGQAGRGTDNERHISSHRVATSWVDSKNQSRWPAFVVAPQGPPGSNWFVRLDLESFEVLGPRPATFTVMAILDSLENEFSIDPDRVYVTGNSAGGAGSWSLANLDQERFAAAIPMSAGYFYQFAERFDGLPLWIVHGERDTEADPTFSRTMIASFMDRQRSVLFLDCAYDPDDCEPISDEDFARGMASHAEVVYAGIENGRHDGNLWTSSYDDPRLTGVGVFSASKNQGRHPDLGAFRVSNLV